MGLTRLRIGLACLALAALASAARAAGPRIVSINLCTDQLALELADPDQILGLGPYARDGLRSPYAEQAARFPRLSGTAEEVIALRPDIVLSGTYTKRATRDLVRGQGFRLVERDPPRSIEAALRQLRETAALLGHPERGETAALRIEAAVGAARAAATERPLTALALQRRGWVSGGGTLLGAIMEAVGLRNAGATFAAGLGRQVPLEAIVAAHPDRLLVASGDGHPEDQGSALLDHPALRRLYPPERRLVLPERLGASCGGSTLVDALDRLRSELRKNPA